VFGGTRELIKDYCRDLIKLDLVGDDWQHLLLKTIAEGDDDLIVAERFLNAKLFFTLSRLLPSLQQVVVYTRKESFAGCLPQLFNKWSKCNMRCISLFVKFRAEHMQLLPRITTILNSSSSIVRLDLLVD